ncbi:hypothetical protein D3OALGA1CA_3301 [Olavius algarvensis associated proteobacterium Delta 3]|nr:hypothetical protein D3OALGA1CA_3301 [Olavius algarvensis associated proteobacterium Delta 3]CAB5165029.1 hypothetical protein D3OALGB2SA_5688 [Olavius algarvensis associated proteobacterium Delta 3]
MPIYEYECSKCGQVEEVMQKFSDKPLSRCPLCKGKLRKLMSQSTFHLKGSGWYVTDYANKSKPDRASSDTKSTAKSETKKEKPSGSASD